MTPLSTQFIYFFLTVGIGIVIGVTFDLYRVFRGIIQPRKIVTNLGDLFFWVFVTALVFALLVFGNWGEVRLYVFIGLAIGLVAYLKLLSKFTIHFVVGTINLIRKILLLLKKAVLFIAACILYPIRLVYRILLVPAGIIKRFGTKVKSFIKKYRTSIISKVNKRKAVRKTRKQQKKEKRKQKKEARAAKRKRILKKILFGFIKKKKNPK